MITLILILGQILILAAALKLAFLSIDKLTLIYRRKMYQSRQNQFNKKKAQARQELITKLSKTARRSNSWNQLSRRLDAATAERLINNLRQKYPGKSEQWYIEKALYDLDRDRGR